MAHTPKKMKDPTDAALSAIQDALTVRDTAPEAEPINPPPPAATRHDPVTRHDSATRHDDEPASEPPWRTVRSAAPVQEDMYDDEVRHPDEQGSLRRPANDDRESI